MFSVIKFESDGSIQLVPSSWLNSNKNVCKWPAGPNKNISSQISKCKAPEPWWTDLRVKIYKTCGKNINLAHLS